MYFTERKAPGNLIFCVQSITLPINISTCSRSQKMPVPLSVCNYNCVCLFNFSSSFLCPICPAVFQYTTHRQSLTVQIMLQFTVQFRPPPANPSVFRPHNSLRYIYSTEFQLIYTVATQTQTHTIQHTYICMTQTVYSHPRP